jgi:hypothetical protein
LDICHLQLMNRNSMKEPWQHEGFGIHYCHPTSYSLLFACSC